MQHYPIDSLRYIFLSLLSTTVRLPFGPILALIRREILAAFNQKKKKKEEVTPQMENRSLLQKQEREKMKQHSKVFILYLNYQGIINLLLISEIHVELRLLSTVPPTAASSEIVV